MPARWQRGMNPTGGRGNLSKVVVKRLPRAARWWGAERAKETERPLSRRTRHFSVEAMSELENLEAIIERNVSKPSALTSSVNPDAKIETASIDRVVHVVARLLNSSGTVLSLVRLGETHGSAAWCSDLGWLQPRANYSPADADEHGCGGLAPAGGWWDGGFLHLLPLSRTPYEGAGVLER
ncbi:hypothetical protein LY76DRAFT_44515 [Colletotrichum caudatum]|nr:hypothetical protein LY76DRAFT_44515 [Colletotrichum caudatum]